jgi:hypothetical protein
VEADVGATAQPVEEAFTAMYPQARFAGMGMVEELPIAVHVPAVPPLTKTEGDAGMSIGLAYQFVPSVQISGLPESATELRPKPLAVPHRYVDAGSARVTTAELMFVTFNIPRDPMLPTAGRVSVQVVEQFIVSEPGKSLFCTV